MANRAAPLERPAEAYRAAIVPRICVLSFESGRRKARRSTGTGGHHTGVLRMIGAGGVPLPIEDHEMASLQAVQESGLRNTSWPYLREGQRVELVDGPLRGTQGFLSSVREEDHLVISVTLLQRSIAVRVRRDWIRPL
jgi:hypothetical protein